MPADTYHPLSLDPNPGETVKEVKSESETSEPDDHEEGVKNA